MVQLYRMGVVTQFAVIQCSGLISNVGKGTETIDQVTNAVASEEEVHGARTRDLWGISLSLRRK